MTVVGPPGSGKTLLVRHAAERQGVAWVDARALHGLDEVLLAALGSLGAETAPGDTLVGALGRALDGRDCLLVLDGLDLDATGAGPAIEAMLEGTTDVRVVVTARTTAGEPHESVVRVGPLPVPHQRAPLEGPAVELFLRGIRAAGGQHVDLTTQAHEVRRLLSATGGLPLLIEQVAVQSALVGLSNAMSTVSLDQAVDSAHGLLDPSSATALRRIGLLDFPVGLGVLAHVLDRSTAEAAELAGNLVRRSLLEVDQRGHFDMLSPIRGRARALAGRRRRRGRRLRPARLGPEPRPRPRQLRRRGRRVAARPAGHAPRRPHRLRRPRHPRRGLLGGQPDLLLPLHLHARP